MHVSVSPKRLEATPGVPQQVTVTIGNTGSVIGGYAVRLLGADPSWVEMAEPEVSLFPEETGSVVLTLTVPPGMTAGDRRFTVQVRELTPPETSVVEELVLTVPAAPSVRVRVDPVAAKAGRTAKLSLLVDNTGNSVLSGRLHGQDPEGKVRFAFKPEAVSLAPGHHAMVEVRASAKQPFFGGPIIRPLELRLLTPDQDPQSAAAGAAGDQLTVRRRGRRTPVRVSDDVPPDAAATFVQRGAISRGSLSLLGLLAAITVFAVVITFALSQLVSRSQADRDLALEIAAARDAGATSGSSAVGGTVRLLTTGKPVSGVTVSLFGADDTETALTSTSTGDDGSWTVGDLPAGEYKVTFRGAGFEQLWYPQAVDPADADTVEVGAGDKQLALDVALGGVPASVAGTVVGDDVSGATLTLRTPGTGATSGSPTVAGAGVEPDATVLTAPIGSDGAFELTDVPSPSIYELVVEKDGYATSTQQIDVSAGEERTGVEVTLRSGDGVISGKVTTAGGPIGGATVTATSGQTSVTTRSVDDGAVGTFQVRGLPTPGTFTLVVSKPGFATQTLTMTLGDGQQLRGVDVGLDRSSGSLHGDVVQLPTELPASGVLVTITDGTTTVQTATQAAGELGSWKVSGLPLPGDYTVTFSRSDLASQTVAVTLDGQGAITSESQGAVVTDDGISVRLLPATAQVSGTVTQLDRSAPAGTPGVALGEATVQLISNDTTYTVVSASLPQDQAGHFEFAGIPPGSYTLQASLAGVTPTSMTVVLAAGDVRRQPLELDAPASITGQVVKAGGGAVGAGWVVELYRSTQYPSTSYQTVRTDSDGRFTFEVVDAPEAYVVQVRRTDGGPAQGSETIDVDRSADARVKVVVKDR